MRVTLIKDLFNAKAPLPEGTETMAEIERLRYESERLGEAKAMIQKALGNGADEVLWHPGESWVEAAIRAIEFYENNWEALG